MPSDARNPVITTSAIVAVSENGVIGRQNSLPWQVPEDLQYFKAITMGKPLVMGRRTFDSIGKPLPGRPTVVLSSRAQCCPAGVHAVTSVPAALQQARELARSSGVDEIVIVGGASVYRATLPIIDKLYLTQIHMRVEGDTFFPELDSERWSESSRSERLRSKLHGVEYSFRVYRPTADGAG